MLKNVKNKQIKNILLTFISRIKIFKNVKYSRIKCLQITGKYQKINYSI